jgi:hypothetical protein
VPTAVFRFNTSAFVQQTKGTLGDELRNQVFGPPHRRVDLSVFKLFDFREFITLQFRTEVFDLTNRRTSPSLAPRLGRPTSESSRPPRRDPQPARFSSV